MSVEQFLVRVFQNLPRGGKSLDISSWSESGKQASEAVAVYQVSSDVDKMASRIMDVDHYKGNIDHVLESRAVPDPNYTPPESVRFYQRVNIPLLAVLHMELGLHDFGERDGWRVIGWHLLEGPTDRLNPKIGSRFDYNDGAWLLKPDRVGYALSTAPRKKDIGRIKFAIMTKGAEAGAPAVLKNNIQGMVRWSQR